MSRILGAACAVFLMALCGGAQAADLPGLYNSKERPVGAPFVLPEGIELEEPIKAYDQFDEDSCKLPEDEAPPEPVGVEGVVRLCLVFRNTTGGPINIDLPPGIIFESESTETQHGILIQRASIEVPAPIRYVSLLKLACANPDRSAPNGGRLYRLGPVTEHPHIVEALRLLADRDLSQPAESYAAQLILTSLYDGSPLTDDHRQQIGELPAR